MRRWQGAVRAARGLADCAVFAPFSAKAWGPQPLGVTTQPAPAVPPQHAVLRPAWPRLRDDREKRICTGHDAVDHRPGGTVVVLQVCHAGTGTGRVGRVRACRQAPPARPAAPSIWACGHSTPPLCRCCTPWTGAHKCTTTVRRACARHRLPAPHLQLHSRMWARLGAHQAGGQAIAPPHASCHMRGVCHACRLASRSPSELPSLPSHPTRPAVHAQA